MRDDPETAALVTAMRGELARSLEELRELAQGIHPAALTDHGLPVELETVTTRCAIPCSLTVAAWREYHELGAYHSLWTL